MLRLVSRLCAALGFLALLGASDTPDASAVIAPKVVVVAMFEIGNDSGDRPVETSHEFLPCARFAATDASR